jgi:hypothetical protein
MDTVRFNIGGLIYIAGLAQIVLALGSLAIPGILQWRLELIKVRPLIKQMFWTYAAYIFGINLFFGLLSLFDSGELINGTKVSTFITGFIFIYWISRVLIQFFYFDRSDFPTGKWNKFGEILLVTLFISLGIVYGWAFIVNYKQI